MADKPQVEIEVEVVFSGMAGRMVITGREVTFDLPNAVRPRHVALAAAIGKHIKAIRHLVDYYVEE